MSDNPLDHDPERERRIRERAYQLWESEGRPHGRDADYWERARELIGIEDHPDAGQLPNPEAEGANPNVPEVIEEAAIQENYGEIPGRLTDQGDRPQTPTPRKPHEAGIAEPPQASPKIKGSTGSKVRASARADKNG